MCCGACGAWRCDPAACALAAAPMHQALRAGPQPLPPSYLRPASPLPHTLQPMGTRTHRHNSKHLPCLQLAQVEPLSAEAAAAAADRPEPPLGVECRVAADVQRLTQAVSALVAAREAAAASAGGRGGAGGGDGGQVVPGGEDAEVAEVPEEYLDPILATLMQARAAAGMACWASCWDPAPALALPGFFRAASLLLAACPLDTRPLQPPPCRIRCCCPTAAPPWIVPPSNATSCPAAQTHSGDCMAASPRHPAAAGSCLLLPQVVPVCCWRAWLPGWPSLRLSPAPHLPCGPPPSCSRAPLSKEQLISNHELRQQIEAWLQQHPHHSHSHHS